MKGKPLLFYVLGIIAAAVAVIIFIKSFDWRSLLILVFGIASALLIRQGSLESKKKKE